MWVFLPKPLPSFLILVWFFTNIFSIIVVEKKKKRKIGFLDNKKEEGGVIRMTTKEVGI